MKGPHRMSHEERLALINKPLPTVHYHGMLWSGTRVGKVHFDNQRQHRPSLEQLDGDSFVGGQYSTNQEEN